MKRLFVVGLAALTLPGFLLAQNTLSETEKKEGWISLFDGHSTTGWHRYGNKPAGKGWSAADGSLHLDPAAKDGGDLVTDQTYTNFDLKLQWKISKNGNSGIMFDVNEDPQFKEPWNTGPEVQVLDNDGHPDGKIKKHRAGDLYDLISSSSEPVRPVGEWNDAEIKLNQGKLEIFLNGVNVVTTTMWNDHWWELVKGSKFASMPGFSKFKTGHIALQDHGNEVWYRDIRIRAL